MPYPWVWAFVFRALADFSHFLAFLEVLPEKATGFKIIMVCRQIEQELAERKCGVEDCKGDLRKLPFSAILCICPLCRPEARLPRSLKIGAALFHHY